MNLILTIFLLIGLSSQLPQPSLIAGREDLSHTRGHDIKLIRRTYDTTAGWSAWVPHPTASNVPSSSGFVTVSGSQSVSPSSRPSATPSPGNIVAWFRHAYLFPVTIDGRNFDLELDTGSSDTWVVQPDFECYQKYKSQTQAFEIREKQEYCMFEKTYSPGSGFDSRNGASIFGCYSEASQGLCVVGPLGRTSVTLGDITVRQDVGAIKKVC